MLDLNAKYEVVTYSVGDTKAGTKMGKMQLKNLVDESILNCILWEETLNRLNPVIFRCGNIIKIITASYNEKFNNCLVNNLELIQEAILGLNEQEQEQYYKKITDKIKQFDDKKLSEFVLEILEKHKDLFKSSPAAKMMHHNYLGGLILHTWECLEFAEVVYPKLNNKVNKDYLYAACILHDIGKIFEYKMDLETGIIDYCEEFKKDWLSHSQYGFSLCMSKGYHQIAKMIAAHHGRTEWGAMVDLGERDLEPFYYIVHHIDDLSAKFGKISVNDLR